MISESIQSLKYLKSKIRSLARRRHGRLVRRYFLISVLVVAGGLVASGLLEIYFRLHESREHLAILQKEAATVAAVKIEKFIQDVETAMRGAAKGLDVDWKGDSSDYRFELKRLLLPLAPAITQALALDHQGTQLAQLSRLRIVSTDRTTELSSTAAFQRARQGHPYFGPVFFARDSEPYMTIAVPIVQFKGEIVGVLQADVNLKYVWDVVSTHQGGESWLRLCGNTFRRSERLIQI